MNSILATPTVKPLVSVRRLRVWLRPRALLARAGRGEVRAIENLDLDLHAGEVLGVVGESGCGKTILAHTLCGLQEATSGSIRYEDRELARAGESAWAAQRRHVQLIGPDSLRDLRPKAVVGRVLAAGLKALRTEPTAGARAQRVSALLLQVGLQTADADRHLKSLSPVEQLRLAIARALVPRPQLLICDEPAVMLDEPDQLQIIDLLSRLRRENGLGIVFMAREPALARHLCDRVMVLYLGRVMEQGECDAVFEAPAHPYTRALLTTPLTLETSKRGGRRTRLLLAGERPHPAHPPIGCVFHPRCPMAEAACVREVPHPQRTGATARHYATCLFAPQPLESSAGNVSRSKSMPTGIPPPA